MECGGPLAFSRVEQAGQCGDDPNCKEQIAQHLRRFSQCSRTSPASPTSACSCFDLWWALFSSQRLHPSEGPGDALKERRDVEGLHDCSRDCRGRWRSGSRHWRTHTTRRFRIDPSLGAIQKKVFSWHTGFWGEKTYGWHYDLMFIPMNLLIVFTDGGQYVLVR